MHVTYVKFLFYYNKFDICQCNMCRLLEKKISKLSWIKLYLSNKKFLYFFKRGFLQYQEYWTTLLYRTLFLNYFCTIFKWPSSSTGMKWLLFTTNIKISRKLKLFWVKNLSHSDRDAEATNVNKTHFVLNLMHFFSWDSRNNWRILLRLHKLTCIS